MYQRLIVAITIITFMSVSFVGCTQSTSNVENIDDEIKNQDIYEGNTHIVIEEGQEKGTVEEEKKMPFILEAENGKLSGVEVHTEKVGFSGSGYVGQFENDGDFVELDVVIPKEAVYQLRIRYLLPIGYGNKINSIYVNDELLGEIEFEEGEDFKERDLGNIKLSEGTNSIKFQKALGDWGWMFVDSFIIDNATENTWNFNISDELINSEADKKTKKLYKYLCSIYGEQMLAGQQLYFGEEEEIDRILEVTGKYPALKGYDMINQTPGGSIDDQVDRAKEWYLEHKGIVTMCWHWWAPKYEREFYTEKTQFDITKAVTHGTEEYDLIIRDMDIVAQRLKEMEDAGIPVLWRPLHEASGGWFWWGAKGPEAFKELWKLMYERFTYHHELNNLIWVWNGQDPDWYVGDEYCDIVGEDIYPGERVYSANPIKFGECHDIVKGGKPIALTETGCLPSIDQMEETGAWWLWFMIWWGDFITTDKYNDYEMLKYIYNHENVITLDELSDLEDS